MVRRSGNGEWRRVRSHWRPDRAILQGLAYESRTSFILYKIGALQQQSNN